MPPDFCRSGLRLELTMDNYSWIDFEDLAHKQYVLTKLTELDMKVPRGLEDLLVINGLKSSLPDSAQRTINEKELLRSFLVGFK